MDILMNSLVLIVGIIFLDCTLGRWLLRFTTTFQAVAEKGNNPDSKRLIVHLPGFIMDGYADVQKIKNAFLNRSTKRLYIRSGYHRYLIDHIVQSTAAEIGRPSKEIDKIIFFASSMGGFPTAPVVKLLHEEYGWHAGTIEVKEDDEIEATLLSESPLDENSVQPQHRKMARLLARLYPGPIISLIAAPFVVFGLGLPKREDTACMNDAEFRRIWFAALRRAFRFRLSSICDYQRVLHRARPYWAEDFKGRVIYIDFDGNNETMCPETSKSFGGYIPAGLLEAMKLHAGHVAYDQQPAECERVISEALDAITGRYHIGTQVTTSQDLVSVG